jgi:hypothetical protein
MAGVAVVCCVKPACTLCQAGGEAACGYCFRLVCWLCAPAHTAACAAAAGVQLPQRTVADYEDSVYGQSTATGHETESLDEACSTEPDFFCSMEKLWANAGYGALDAHFDGRLHRLPIMSRCSVYEPALGTWRFFGDLDTFRFLASALEWELHAGIVVVHCGAKTCLLFRNKADPVPLAPSEAMTMLAEKPASICLVVSATESGSHEVAHLELQQAIGSRGKQTRQRNVLDKLLRALIGSYDVAFWRPE